MADLPNLFTAWIEAKAAEKSAMAARREIEDQLASVLKVPEDLEGTHTPFAPDGFKIKVTGRMNRKIDADKLQELARDAGLYDHLSTLFSWKPSINMGAWKHADKSLTTPLAGAITTTPGRPSFTITQEK